jgi:O-antigen/teichoic acid export membrane protein
VSAHSESAPPVVLGSLGQETGREVAEAAFVEQREARESLSTMRRAARGAFVETGGYALGLAVRFGSNLVLTRLLQPEVFGLLAMVQLIHFSLHMLADVGLSQAVTSNQRGDDDDFLNTIWSMQVVRGVALTIATLLATWPAAVWFREPRMYWIVPITTIGTFIHGFVSSRVFTCQRHLRLGALLKLEFGTQTLAVAINLIGAYLGYGLISLLIGQLVGTILYTTLSHFLPGTTHRDRWHTDPTIRSEVLRFGRWIFLSSALTVVATRGDSAMLGRILGPAMLGLYNLATNIADLPETLSFRIVNSVLYPTMSRTYNEAPATFRKVFYRLRFYFDAAAHTALGGLAAMSAFVIEVLYDERYRGAGVILAVFAVRASIGTMIAPWETAFFARGITHFGFRRALISSIALLIAMPLGYQWFGWQGVIWGTVVARSTALLVLWPPAYIEGLLSLRRELLPAGFFAAGYLLGSLAEAVLRRLF